MTPSKNIITPKAMVPMESGCHWGWDEVVPWNERGCGMVELWAYCEEMLVAVGDTGAIESVVGSSDRCLEWGLVRS